MSTLVLIVEDEVSIAQSLQCFLEDCGFDACTASNGKEGLAAVHERKPDIVIVDLHMPVMNGYKFIEQANALDPNLPIVILSSEGMVDNAMAAIRAGGWDFVSKPLSDMQLLLHAIEQNLEKARLIKENLRYQEHLETLVTERTRELEKTQRQILTCLGKAAEFKDSYTGSHVCRVARMSYLIARGLGLEESFCKIIRDAAPMHDVGKIGIQDDVLLKTGALNAEEREHIQAHVNIGCTILCTSDGSDVGQTCSTDLLVNHDQDLSILTVAKRIALFHHERWDGKGYPFGLSEEMIPIEARIVGLVDVYDALSSKRPYKVPFPENRCQELIKKGSGIQFDPAVVDVFFGNIDGILQIKQRLTN